MEYWNPAARDSDRFPEEEDEDDEPVEEFCPQCLQPYRSDVGQADGFYPRMQSHQVSFPDRTKVMSKTKIFPNWLPRPRLVPVPDSGPLNYFEFTKEPPLIGSERRRQLLKEEREARESHYGPVFVIPYEYYHVPDNYVPVNPAQPGFWEPTYDDDPELREAYMRHLQAIGLAPNETAPNEVPQGSRPRSPRPNRATLDTPNRQPSLMRRHQSGMLVPYAAPAAPAPPPPPYDPAFDVGFEDSEPDVWQPPYGPQGRPSRSPNSQPLMIRHPSGMLVVPDAAAAAPPAPPPAPPARPRRAIPRWQRAPVPRAANVAPKAVAQAPIRAQVAPLNRRRPVVPVVAPNQRRTQNYAVPRGGSIGFDVRDLDRVNRRGRPVPIPDRPRWRY